MTNPSSATGVFAYDRPDLSVLDRLDHPSVDSLASMNGFVSIPVCTFAIAYIIQYMHFV
jgi:hypothetical protein